MSKEIKVGDIVKVSDFEKVYPSYTNFITQHVDDPKVIAYWSYDRGMNMHDLELEYEVVALAKHEDYSSLIAVITNIDANRTFIVGVNGLEKSGSELMTNRQLAEWLAKGNGEYTDSKGKYCMPVCVTSYSEGSRDEPVREGITIRTWDSDEWIEPTVVIYERDCKGQRC